MTVDAPRSMVLTDRVCGVLRRVHAQSVSLGSYYRDRQEQIGCRDGLLRAAMEAAEIEAVLSEAGACELVDELAAASAPVRAAAKQAQWPHPAAY